jgi:hypothetical protein
MPQTRRAPIHRRYFAGKRQSGIRTAGVLEFGHELRTFVGLDRFHGEGRLGEDLVEEDCRRGGVARLKALATAHLAIGP